MNGKIALVLLSVLGAGAALPSVATATLAADHEDRLDFDADSALRRLQANGLAATSVEEWNGLLRAYIQRDGQLVMQYFDPDTLAPVDA